MLSPQRQPLFLGIDFGSAFTRIAHGLAESGQISRLLALDYYGVPAHPSGVAHDQNHGHWLSGRAWEAALCSDLPLQNWSDPRSDLASSAQNNPQWQMDPVFEAVQRLFLRLSAQVLESSKGAGSGGAALCLPLEATGAFKTAIRKAVSLPQLEFLSVPEAAVLGFDIASRLDERARIIGVFDAGASGCRCTFLEVRKRQGFVTARLLASAQSEKCGGKSLDQTLFERLQFKNPELKTALAQLDTQARGAAIAEALWQMHSLRLRLESTREASCEAVLQRLQGQTLSLERLTVENVTEDFVLEAARVLDSALEQAGIGADRISTMLPIGGLTRIVSLGKMLAARVPYLETSPSILATNTDLLAPARGAARYAASVSSQSAAIRFAPLQTPLFGVRIGGEIDAILPVNAPHKLRRSKIYASTEAVAGGVDFEIWSGFGRSVAGATHIGDVSFAIEGQNYHLDEKPLRVTLELLDANRLRVEIDAPGSMPSAPLREVFEQTRPQIWQKAG